MNNHQQGVIDVESYNRVFWHHSLWMSAAGPRDGQQDPLDRAVLATQDAELHSAWGAVLDACHDWIRLQTAEAQYYVMDRDATFLMILSRRIAPVAES